MLFNSRNVISGSSSLPLIFNKKITKDSHFTCAPKIKRKNPIFFTQWLRILCWVVNETIPIFSIVFSSSLLWSWIGSLMPPTLGASRKDCKICMLERLQFLGRLGNYTHETAYSSRWAFYHGESFTLWG